MSHKTSFASYRQHWKLIEKLWGLERTIFQVILYSFKIFSFDELKTLIPIDPFHLKIKILGPVKLVELQLLLKTKKIQKCKFNCLVLLAKHTQEYVSLKKKSLFS